MTRIKRPVGFRLRAVLAWLYRKRTMQTVFEPILTELSVEHCEAVTEHRKCKAAWVRLRGYWSVIIVILLQLVEFIKKFLPIWR